MLRRKKQKQRKLKKQKRKQKRRELKKQKQQKLKKQKRQKLRSGQDFPRRSLCVSAAVYCGICWTGARL